MNSNGDHGASNVDIEEKTGSSGRSYAFYLYVCVRVCVRGTAHREHERREKKE